MKTNSTPNVERYIKAAKVTDEMDRSANWSGITKSDDPRIEAIREYNAALSALTDEEIDMVEKITGWII